jgi:general secretion pathway protein H
MSATGNKGFTLIEVLAVVAIAGLIVALASVNLFPTNAEIARRETGLLALAIEGARDDAWFGGRPTAVSVDEARFRQWRLGNNRRWEPEITRERAVGEGLKVTSLYVDGQPLPPDERLVFLSDGFGIAFRMTVDVRGVARAIEGDAAGAVRVVDVPGTGAP